MASTTRSACLLIWLKSALEYRSTLPESSPSSPLVAGLRSSLVAALVSTSRHHPDKLLPLVDAASSIMVYPPSGTLIVIVLILLLLQFGVYRYTSIIILCYAALTVLGIPSETLLVYRYTAMISVTYTPLRGYVGCVSNLGPISRSGMGAFWVGDPFGSLGDCIPQTPAKNGVQWKNKGQNKLSI